MQSATLPFGSWQPDIMSLSRQGTGNILNVYPVQGAYKPFRSPSDYSDALAARCQGGLAIKDNAGNSVNFAGDKTKLYKLVDASWEDVSRTSGGAYATDATGRWSFVQYGGNIVAANGVDALQKFTLASASDFVALGGSPPTATHLAVVRDFVVAGNLSTDRSAIHWSAFNDVEGWTIGTDQSDVQSFPEGGWVQGVVGGETMYVFQETSIRRGTYVGGQIIFQFDEIASGRGLVTPGALSRIGDQIFFLDQDGFYQITSDQIIPIGAEQVNRTFWADVDTGNLDRISSAIDPVNNLVLWSYPSTSSADGQPDSIILYNWVKQEWGKVSLSHQIMVSALQPGFTLEGLDDINTSIDALPFSLDSRIWTGGTVYLSIFSTASKLAYLTGDTLEGTLDTPEKQLIPGRRARIIGTRPLTDSNLATVALGGRERLSDQVSFKAAASMRASGSCNSTKTGRYLTERLVIPAGADWSEASGVEIEFVDAGQI